MPRFLINQPQNWNEIQNFILNSLNNVYGKQPGKIIFICGDAHAPGGGAGHSLDICNNIANMIIDGAFSPYCSQRMCRNQLSFHLECGNYPDAIQDTLNANNIENLNGIGLNYTDIFGWEPIGFGDFNKISSLMQLPEMNIEQISEAGVLINQSNRYFNNIQQDWTLRIIEALSNLAETIGQNYENRIQATIAYTNALLAQRINANNVLGQSINQSIINVNKLFVHFISVGNAHIVEGDTIINGIDILDDPYCVGFSIGRI